MIEYAEKTFKLDKKVDGVSMRSHLEQEFSSSGVMPEELNVPPFPDILIGVWTKYLSLHRGRTYGISGANPISYADIAAWTGVTGDAISFWEISVVMELDQAYFRAKED